MNLYLLKNRSSGCVKHFGEEICPAQFALQIEQRFFCGPGAGSSSSSSSQTAENYQVGVQTAPGAPGVGIGANANVGALSLKSSATNSNNYSSVNITTSGATAADAGVVGVAGQALTTAQESAAQEAELVSGLGTTAFGAATSLGGQALTTATTGLTLANNLGTAAIASGSNATLAALQFAQNESNLNYNELNQQTSLAFSTINALDTAGAAGAVSAAAQDTLAAATAAAQNSAAQPTVIYEPGAPQYGSNQSVGGSPTISSTAVFVLAIAAVAAIYFFKKT